MRSNLEILEYIDAIENNYPPERYAMLREALDYCLNELKTEANSVTIYIHHCLDRLFSRCEHPAEADELHDIISEFLEDIYQDRMSEIE